MNKENIAFMINITFETFFNSMSWQCSDKLKNEQYIEIKGYMTALSDIGIYDLSLWLECMTELAIMKAESKQRHLQFSK